MQLADVPESEFEAVLAHPRVAQPRRILEERKPAAPPVEKTPNTHTAQSSNVRPRDPQAHLDAIIADINQLPETHKAKAMRLVTEANDLLHQEFHWQVEDEVKRRLGERQANLEALEEKARAANEAAAQMLASIDTHMSEEEYRLVLGCLHPDRPDRDPKRLAQAFAIFKRLESTVNPKTPIAVLRRRGWERKSPFYKAKTTMSEPRP
jgi:hypothetical protein